MTNTANALQERPKSLPAWEDETSEAGPRANGTRPLTHSSDLTREGLAMKATRTCSIDGCDAKHFGKGLCSKHHRRLWKNGTTEGPEDARMTASGFTDQQIKRFWAKVDTSAGPDGCWPWTGVVDKRTGYAFWSFTLTEKCSAHRAAWAIANNQPAPPDKDVDHVYANGCRRRDCCNPAHLEAVTHAENMQRLPVCRKGHEVTGDNAAPANSNRGIQCRICRDERSRRSHNNRKNRSNTE